MGQWPVTLGIFQWSWKRPKSAPISSAPQRYNSLARVVVADVLASDEQYPHERSPWLSCRPHHAGHGPARYGGYVIVAQHVVVVANLVEALPVRVVEHLKGVVGAPHQLVRTYALHQLLHGRLELRHRVGPTRAERHGKHKLHVEVWAF